MDAPRWLTPGEQRTWRALVWSSQVLQESLDRQLQREAGMPHAYYTILVRMSELPGRRCTMTELAQMTQFSASRLSHAMTRLEKRDWITRAKDRRDPRTTIATLTDTGFEALRVAAPSHVEHVRSIIFDRFDDEEQKQLRTLCEKLLDTFADLEDRRWPFPEQEDLGGGADDVLGGDGRALSGLPLAEPFFGVTEAPVTGDR